MNIREHYSTKVVDGMKEKFHYRNIMAVPRLIKVVLNVGISSAKNDPKVMETVKDTLRLITGQQPAERKAKKSISNFKIRKGQVVGLTVTLRGKRMYDFVEKLISLTLPRVRDFRGLREETLDSHGNLTIGLREAVSFPEIKAGDMERQHGIEITVVTNAKKKEEGLALFKLLGFPFRSK